MIRFILLWIEIFIFQSTIAYALPANNASAEIETKFDSNIFQAPKLAIHIPFPINLNSLDADSANSDYGSWIEEKLGMDFYQFFTHKIGNKPANAASLKFDYFLESQLSTSKSAANNTVQTLFAPQISFSENDLQWNPANIALMSLGNDYQHFIDDALLNGLSDDGLSDNTNSKGFKSLIDEYVGFHDSALKRILIFLCVGLVTVITFVKRGQFTYLLLPNKTKYRSKKWLSSIR